MIFSFDETTYTFSNKRLKDLFEYSSAPGEPFYAKAYAAYISPKDYLSLTCPDPQRFIDNAKPLDYNKLCSERQEIYLRVDFDSGEVVGHEGRHRMAALHNAGAELVAVTVYPYGDKDKYNRQFIDHFTVKGQNFDYLEPPCRAPGVVNLECLVPLSEAFKDTVREHFGPGPALETYIGKKVYAVEGIYQFSNDEKVGERKECIGRVKGLSDNRNFAKSFESPFKWTPAYVCMYSEHNPVGYRDYAIKVEDFLKWIKNGRYKIPAKDMAAELDDLIVQAESKVLKKEQLLEKVQRSLERG